MEVRRMLALCAAYLEENGMEFAFAEKGENGQPVDMLLLPGFQTEPMSERQMEMAVYVPEDENAFAERMQVRLLHLLGDVALDTRPETLRELRTLIGEINQRMPMGAFDADADGTVYLRYTLPVPDEMEETAFLRQFAATVNLLGAYALVFLTPMLAVSEGQCTAKAALELAGAQMSEMMHAFAENGEK